MDKWDMSWDEIIQYLLSAAEENLIIWDCGQVWGWDEGDEAYVECSRPDFVRDSVIIHNHPYLDRRSARAARADLDCARMWGARALVLVCRTPRGDVAWRYTFGSGCIVYRRPEPLP